MFMGFQRSLLTLDPVGRLVGTVQIPSCTQHAMQWKITLLTSDAHSPLQAEFSMYTHN